MIPTVLHDQSVHIFTDGKAANLVMSKVVGTQFLLLKTLGCI